mgnify:CR=1 FL=1
MKTALCFAGTGRATEFTFSHLKEMLIEPLGDDCDVIVDITDTPYSGKVEKLFNSVSSNVEIVKEEPIDISPYKFQPLWPPATQPDYPKGRHIYLQMVKARRRLVDRMDVNYEVPLNKSIDHLPLNDLWIPNVHNWCGGHNDRFAVSNEENMVKYLSQWDYMPQYASDGLIFHAETSLKYHLSNMGIAPKHFRCDFIRIKPNGAPRETFNQIRNQAVIPCEI